MIGLTDNEVFLKKVFHRHVASSIFSMFGGMVGSLLSSLLAGLYLGTGGLAVMSVVAPFYFLYSVIGSLAGVGGVTIAAYALGRDDEEGAGRIFSLSVYICLGLSLAASLFCYIPLDTLLYAFGSSPAIQEEAYAYALVFLAGGFGPALFYIPFNFLRLMGRLGLIVGLCFAMSALNLVLALFFLQILQTGVAGLALATVLSYIVAALTGLYLLLKGDYPLRLKKIGSSTEVRKLLKSGTPAAANNLFAFVRLIAMNRLLLALAGEEALAVFSVVTALENFSLIVLSGLAQGTSPFVGVFTKEYDTVSVRRIEKEAHIVGLGLTTILSLALLIFPAEISSLFGLKDEAVVAMTTEALEIFAFSLPLSLCAYLMFFYYQAAGFTTLANWLVFCRAFLFVLLPAYLLGPLYGPTGVWWALVIAPLSPLVLMVFLRPHYVKQGYVGWLLQDLKAEINGSYLSFSVPTITEEIIKSSEAVVTFCRQNDLNRKETLLIRMAMEEMLLSIKEHAFPTDSKEMMDGRILLIRKGPDLTIVLRIRSAGHLFNPLAYYERLQQEDPLALGDALGIAMVLKAADAVHYKTTFGVNNLTVLIDRKAAGKAEGGDRPDV